ncbi:sodium/potassium/calcium exchanger 2-like isoform X2 [Poeciliopsis prolifica]|uniref:sodium/potassium/calcium exchanger 2-like isoform X2 n=1 Tax=Poeciliopsis prolifica TaxID=188132 RepID=UPI002413A931|nr:sodium/potassium/calcium exchanger 2-like isoform X2 [Poeciliopsis prolifica]
MESTRCRSQQLIVFAVVFLGALQNWIVGADLTFTLPDSVDNFEKITDRSTGEFSVQHSTYSAPYKEGPEHKSSFLDPKDYRHPSLESSRFDPASHVQQKHMIYPSDLFPIEDRRHGWVALHVFGMIYAFVAHLIVCDQFFVPSLGVIMEKLAISGDVVGVLFMAAGTSIPSFITKLIQVFYYHYNLTVNINPEIGSIAYRSLFVIGTCAMFSRKVLLVRSWPFFRDLSFNMLGFILLIIFLLDSVVAWCESVILVTVFVLYITFLTYDENAEQIMKTQLQKIKGVMKASFVKKCEKVCIPKGEDDAKSPGDCDEECGNENNGGCHEKKFVESKLLQGGTSLSLQVPDKWQEQITYVILLPIILPLWLTLPNIRSQKARKFFVLTFLASIVWIGIFSYLLRWWAHQVDETFDAMGQIRFVEGLIFSSDFITSLIVAHKGLGDMVVSSNLGCSIFIVTLFLPVEWFLYSVIHGFSPVAISTEGLFCASILLFVVLLAAVISIIFFKWRIEKSLGLILDLLFLIFVIIRILMVFEIITCPV